MYSKAPGIASCVCLQGQESDALIKDVNLGNQQTSVDSYFVGVLVVGGVEPDFAKLTLDRKRSAGPTFACNLRQAVFDS